MPGDSRSDAEFATLRSWDFSFRARSASKYLLALRAQKRIITQGGNHHGRPFAIRQQRSPRSRQGTGRHRRLRGQLQGRQRRGLRHGPPRFARQPRLCDARPAIPRLHPASGADRAGDRRARRGARAGNQLSARSDQGGVRHRLPDSLARFQRHLAGGRVGPSVGQPRLDPRRRRLSQPQQRAPRSGGVRRVDACATC